jgi:hypothetical protein
MRRGLDFDKAEAALKRAAYKAAILVDRTRDTNLNSRDKQRKL